MQNNNQGQPNIIGRLVEQPQDGMSINTDRYNLYGTPVTYNYGNSLTSIAEEPAHKTSCAINFNNITLHASQTFPRNNFERAIASESVVKIGGVGCAYNTETGFSCLPRI